MAFCAKTKGGKQLCAGNLRDLAVFYKREQKGGMNPLATASKEVFTKIKAVRGIYESKNAYTFQNGVVISSGVSHLFYMRSDPGILFGESLSDIFVKVLSYLPNTYFAVDMFRFYESNHWYECTLAVRGDVLKAAAHA